MKSLRSTGICTVAHLGEVVDGAAEAPLLGQHADHGGAARLVVGGERGRVGDRGERALGRAGPLDLGDHGDALAAQRGRARRAATGRWPAISFRASSETACCRSARSARTPSRISSSTVTAVPPSP